MRGRAPGLAKVTQSVSRSRRSALTARRAGRAVGEQLQPGAIGGCGAQAGDLHPRIGHTIQPRLRRAVG